MTRQTVTERIAAERGIDLGDKELARLLDELHGEFVRYVVFPTPEAADAVTLYTAATHAQSAWEHASRLVIKSPIKRCGKSRLQDVIAETAHQVLKTTNISPAALVRSIDEKDPPTLILDEADTVFGPKKQRAEGSEDLRGILNSGHSRGWPYIRWDANKRQAEHCATFAMAVIGGIGNMPDTIEDRAVVISMRRRATGETVKQWRRKRAVPPLNNLRERLNACVSALVDALADAEPTLPVEDRAADTWEPLMAIADEAGGDWPARARKACKLLTSEAAADDRHTAGERLLSDLKRVFEHAGKANLLGEAGDLETAAILESLYRFEEAPWRDWDGRKLNPRDLADLLHPYGIRSRNLVRGTKRPKGYRRADLADAGARYTRPAATAATAATSDESAGQSGSGKVAADPDSSATSADQHKRDDVAHVADVAGAGANRATHTIGRELAQCIHCGAGETLVRDEHGRPAHPSCVGGAA